MIHVLWVWLCARSERATAGVTFVVESKIVVHGYEHPIYIHPGMMASTVSASHTSFQSFLKQLLSGGFVLVDACGDGFGKLEWLVQDQLERGAKASEPKQACENAKI